MPSDSDDAFTYRERLLVAPLARGRTKQFLSVRMESAMALTAGATNTITPFPRAVLDLLHNHNATRVVIQVGTSASHSYGKEPLDAVDPWFTTDQRLDLGPSGVLVRASLQIADPAEARTHWESLLHELVAQQLVLAPLFSVSVRRLHRHWTSWKFDSGHKFELILPMEGASLSSEGMHAFVNAFAPCHNQSGIFTWNNSTQLSELFLKNRQSAARHSWWIQMEQDEDTARLTKGMQLQPHLEVNENDNQTTVTLLDLFPNPKKPKRCPFVRETTLEALVPTSRVPLEVKFSESDESTSTEESNDKRMDSRPASPKYWKEPWMTLLPKPDGTPTTTTQQQQQPKWSIHQTLQRPRGVSYAGRWMAQISVNPNNCPVSVQLQWFLPPIVQPTWESFRIVQEDPKLKEERILDWRHDLNGRITAIDPSTGQSDNKMLTFEEGTLFMEIPQWNATTQQTLTIYLDYRPAFLSFEHFPGDANRGVEIPPAQAIFREHCRADASIHLYSNSLLLLPPVPDMSMPFNVLSMTCSLYAFVIGSILNLLIRKSSERVQRTYDPSKIPPPNKLKQLLTKFKEKIKSLKGKGGKNTADKESFNDGEEATEQDGTKKLEAKGDKAETEESVEKEADQ